jgi:hypothetical protein
MPTVDPIPVVPVVLVPVPVIPVVLVPNTPVIPPS